VLFGALLLAGAAYFALFGGEYGYFELRRVRAERALEQQRLEQNRAEVAALRARADSLLHDSATIERVARERHGLLREGEKLYRFVADSADSVPAPADTGGP
jgi:cell division protein FtsB